MISELASNLGESLTLKLNESAEILKAEGKSVINLSAGEPSDEIDESVYKAVIKKIATRRIKYTPATGLLELKKEILNYLKDYYGIKAETPNIVVSSGAKQCIYNFLLSVVNPGDEAVFFAPYWVSYPEMIKMAGAVPVEVKPKKGFLKADMEDFKKALTSKTKAVLFNSPNNPSGMVFDENFVRQLVGICEEKNIYLLSDDIYSRLVFDGEKIPDIFSFSKKALNESGIVSINGVSKMFAMTGFRIGWSLSNGILAEAMGKIQAQITSCPSDLSQAAAEGVLKDGRDFVGKMVSRLEKKRNVIADEFKKLKKASLHIPEGTFYSFGDFSAYDKDDVKLAERLMDKAMVATVPGSGFGMKGYLRISFCADEKDIKEGLERIRKELDGSI